MTEDSPCGAMDAGDKCVLPKGHLTANHVAAEQAGFGARVWNDMFRMPGRLEKRLHVLVRSGLYGDTVQAAVERCIENEIHHLIEKGWADL